MLKMYGIPNCDTIKKARVWLKDHSVDYEFHDYKKLGVSQELLEKWMKLVDWEILLNRRGMMWRKLDDAQKENIDQASAITIMMETPSIIKRPVLEVTGSKILVGFKESEYEKLLG